MGTPSKRPLNLTISRPINESREISSNDIFKHLMTIPVGSSLKSDIGDIVRESEDDFKIRVTPEHFRKALDNILA